MNNQKLKHLLIKVIDVYVPPDESSTFNMFGISVKHTIFEGFCKLFKVIFIARITNIQVDPIIYDLMMNPIDNYINSLYLVFVYYDI